MLHIKQIKNGEKILAIIVSGNKSEKGLEFPTPSNFPLQLGIHYRSKGEYISAHEHIPFQNLNIPVQEILMIEEGQLVISLYDENNKFEDVVLSKGDIILLNCGHSITFKEDSKLVEVKQGPYRDKKHEKISLE